MAYLITTAGARGRRVLFKFENGKYYYTPDGEEFSGTIVFQTVDGTNKKRIFFGDTANALKGAVSKLKGIKGKNWFKSYNAWQKDYLCCFEFKENDILDGRKKFEIYKDVLLGPFLICTIITCYDNINKIGCIYIMPNEAYEDWKNILEPYLQ